MRSHTAVTLPSLVKKIAEGNEDNTQKNRGQTEAFLSLLQELNKVSSRLLWQRFPPLLSQLAVLLPVRGAQAEQWLQTFPAGFYILIVYINVVQVFLLLEDLLSRT